MNVVTVALPDVSRGLQVSPEVAQWAVLGYQLPVVALLLPAGRWLDGAPLRGIVLTTVAAFAGASVLAGVAPWAVWLIAARVVQGMFGAVLFVLMPVLVTLAVRSELRGRAMSVPATLGPLGAAIGPVVGGVLVDHLGWRAIFFVKLPFCLVAFLAARRVLRRGGRLRVPGRRFLGDAALIGAALTAVLLALTLAVRTPLWLTLGAAAALPLGWWLRGPAGRPVRAVLRQSATYGINGAVFALGLAFAAMYYLVALHLRRDAGASAEATGLTVLAFPVAMGLAGPIGGRLADLRGPRPVAVVGAALTAVGLVLLVPLDTAWSPAAVAARLALAGAGMGLYGGPAQTLVMAAAPPDRIVTAGSTVQLARSLGFAMGPAVATTAWALGGRGEAGIRVGLGIAALAACTAVPLLARRRSAEPAVPSEPPVPAGPAAVG